MPRCGHTGAASCFETALTRLLSMRPINSISAVYFSTSIPAPARSLKPPPLNTLV